MFYSNLELTFYLLAVSMASAQIGPKLLGYI